MQFGTSKYNLSCYRAAENVLTTMLNHHAQLPNCPFFRVKGRYGFYALKVSENWVWVILIKQNV